MLRIVVKDGCEELEHLQSAAFPTKIPLTVVLHRGPGKNMNWRLLLYLSFFGAAMAIATISFIPIMVEPVLWLAIFGFCSYSIAKNCDSRFFFHGFILSIINCIYISAFHTAFFDSYSAAHPEFINSLPQGVNPRMASAASGVMIGVASGVIQGLLCLAAAKMQKKL